jgi:CRP-like cAMP-binding protein
LRRARCGTTGIERLNPVLQGSDFLAKKLGVYVELTEHELSYLAELQSRQIQVARGRELTHQGELGQAAYILQSGWACSSKLLPNGGRQVIAFPIPGDIVGLRSMLLRTSDHTFSTLTDALVCRVEESRLKHALDEFPHLGSAILWATSRDEAMVVEHLVSVGRRSALERTAHFFLELYDRLRLVGLASGNEFTCPLSQAILADALGLSAIHVNRVLRQLRERRLLTFHEGIVCIRRPGELATLAGYEILEEMPIVSRERDHRHDKG